MTANNSRLPRQNGLSAIGRVRVGLFIVALALTAVAARADQFHGLNAGAPVWNGAVIFSPQKAAAFAATGTNAVRINFRLDAGATSWNPTQLALYDQVIANAKNAGLAVLGLFSNETVAGGQATWNVDPNGDGTNQYVADFANTALQLVDRYKNDVKQWEVWNEPNAWTNPNYQSNPTEAGGTYILPRVYARMLSDTYRKLNSAGQALLDDHGITLASGGLLAHDIGGSFSTAMDYMQSVYSQNAIWNSLQTDAGRRYPWDDFGYHFYISQGSLVPTSQLASYFNDVRSKQAANNDPAGVVVTEFGWQTVSTNTEELQRDNMATAYDFLESRGYVSGTYWYQWEDDVTGAWGLIHNNGAHKLAYDEFAARNQQTTSSNVTSVTLHAANDAALGLSFQADDLLAGRIAVQRAGDLGWHSANPAAGNSLNPNGLPAFTDGVGDLGTGVTGLLNDFPASGAPAKLIEYELGSAHAIDEIRIFTGNNGNDGRIFSTAAVYTSTDGVSFNLLGYFQSDSSGSTNNAGTPGGAQGSTAVRIFTDDGPPLAVGVTHLRFDLYAASDLEGVFRDPFDGVNAFTGVDDGLARAYVSPLVREIDVLGHASADFNADGAVDGRDFLAWQRGANQPSGAGHASGDANGDGAVNAADLAIWRAQFGGASAGAAIPEPTAITLAALALLGARAYKKRG
jgi:hypothetical protein